MAQTNTGHRRARIGIIGAGWWAALNHIPAVRQHPDAELAAVCRLGDDELQKLLHTFDILYGSQDYRRMLAEVPLDGVIIASPHIAHAEHARAALEAGCHVLVEKPFATSAQDARALRSLAAERSRGLMVPHAWNYKSYAATARGFVADGRIGMVRHLVCQMASPLTDLFAGEPMAETADHLFRPPADTWATPGKAGGYGWGQLTHGLGLLAFVAPTLKPEAVTAIAGLSPAGVDYYDAAIVRFAGGATGVVSGSATVPKGSPFQVDIRLFGTEGMLLLDIERERLILRRHDKVDADCEIAAGDGVPDGVVPLHRFIDLCLGRLTPQSATAWAPVMDIEILDALYRSAASGKTEQV
ncbi:MAG: Gfo/Idh/MocA family oxidoreductase [Methylobacteriaceae bacterium]|nr:Gfo/Idh/MocA family oxidoreductase [Methylobacteriaceae bacterium]